MGVASQILEEPVNQNGVHIMPMNPNGTCFFCGKQVNDDTFIYWIGAGGAEDDSGTIALHADCAANWAVRLMSDVHGVQVVEKSRLAMVPGFDR